METILAFAFQVFFVAWIIFSAPIYIYRFFTTKILAPLLHRRLGKPMSLLGVTYAAELTHKDASNRPQKCGVVSSIVFKGHVSSEEVKETIRIRWLDKTGRRRDNLEAPGPLCYPELRLYVDSWMGFIFWRKDDHFSLRNHIIVHSIKRDARSEEECANFVRDLMEELLNKPFPPKRSPWEVHIIHNFRHKASSTLSTVLILRIHHCLADGFSILTLLVEDLAGEKLSSMQIPKPVASDRKTLWESLLNVQELGSVLLEIFFTCGYGLGLLFSRNVPFKVTPSTKASSRILITRSNLVSVEKMKQVAKRSGVSLTAVIVSSVAAGLGKSIKYLRSPSINQKYFEHLPCGLTLPLKNHPRNKLLNHFTAGSIHLPTNSNMGAHQRLQESQKSLNTLKTSVFPLMVPPHQSLVGAQITPIVRIATENWMFPVTIANFAGPAVPISYRESEVLSADFVEGTLRGKAGVSCSVLSYNGDIRITLAAESCVFTRDELRACMNHVYQELECLQDLPEIPEIRVTLV